MRPRAFKLSNISLLAQSLDFFNDVDDDEVLRLCEKANQIYVRVEGGLSLKVGANENTLGRVYDRRAKKRASRAHDLDRYVANQEFSLRHYREAARIFAAINLDELADEARQNVAKVDELLRRGRELLAIGAAIASRR